MNVDEEMIKYSRSSDRHPDRDEPASAQVYGSTVISALLFAMAHFSLSRSLPLIALGVIISLLFAASRNLVTAVALHSLWNMWVLATITARVAGA